jgi:hypothetical protein
MGNTCASVHILWRGSDADAARAISRAYTKLGYERAKKPADGGKQVVVLTRAGERYVSIYDSTNAELDSGELKDTALAASKLMKTAAVFTSLYDSDSYEFVVFNNGKQVDLLLSDAESYDGPLKRLPPRSRATQWGRIFARPLTADAIEQAAATQTAFADDTVSALCGLIGLAGERAQMHYGDFKRDEEPATATLYFTRKAVPLPAAMDGQISLRNYYDPDNSRKLLVYPASWPMPTGQEQLLTWLMLSEGAGFTGGTATIEASGPAGLSFGKGIMNGAKFHHGQIVGGYELAKDASPEAARAYLESKRFSLTPTGAGYHAEYPNLWVPPMTADRTTQILVILQLHLTAATEGEWDVRVTLHPQSETGFSVTLPGARVAAVEQRWLPVVSGLNPRTTYDTADLVEERLSDDMLDLQIRKTHQPQRSGLSPEQARTSLLTLYAQNRERNHKTWLQDLQHKAPRRLNERGLGHPAIASNVAILRHDGQGCLDICRSYLEAWLRPVVGKGGEVRVRAERQMTQSLHVGKLKKAWPTTAVLSDKVWARLFDCDNEYQSVIVEFVPDGAEFPIAGMGLSCSLRSPSRNDEEWNAYNAKLMAITLGKMRGRRFDPVEHGDTVHVFNWVIAHDTCLDYVATSVAGMARQLDALAAEHETLQAWHDQSTWIPSFDRADDYGATIYEDMSILNFFRGILVEQQLALTDRRMTEPWCRNVLRMVTPHMWLCGDLIDQVDKAALERVAIVTESNGRYKLEKRPDQTMEALELALLPILPIESSRITVL